MPVQQGGTHSSASSCPFSQSCSHLIVGLIYISSLWKIKSINSLMTSTAPRKMKWGHAFSSLDNLINLPLSCHNMSVFSPHNWNDTPLMNMQMDQHLKKIYTSPFSELPADIKVMVYAYLSLAITMSTCHSVQVYGLKWKDMPTVVYRGPRSHSVCAHFCHDFLTSLGVTP